MSDLPIDKTGVSCEAEANSINTQIARSPRRDNGIKRTEEYRSSVGGRVFAASLRYVR